MCTAVLCYCCCQCLPSGEAVCVLSLQADLCRPTWWLIFLLLVQTPVGSNLSCESAKIPAVLGPTDSQLEIFTWFFKPEQTGAQRHMPLLMNRKLPHVVIHLQDVCCVDICSYVACTALARYMIAEKSTIHIGNHYQALILSQSKKRKENWVSDWFQIAHGWSCDSRCLDQLNFLSNKWFFNWFQNDSNGIWLVPK